MPPKRKYTSVEHRRNEQEQRRQSKNKRRTEESLPISMNKHQVTTILSTAATQELLLRASLSTEHGSTSAQAEKVQHSNKATFISDSITRSTPGFDLKTIKRLDPLQDIATEVQILPDIPNCIYCDAKRIYLEPPHFCCSAGEIRLLQCEMPEQLRLLYLDNSKDGCQFRNNIRSYNNMFAFTSLGAHSDKMLSKRTVGIYTYRVQGQLYHFIPPLTPIESQKPANVQLYFFDTENELENRYSISQKFDKDLITKLSCLLKSNPYSMFFRNLGEVQNLDSYKIILKAYPDLDQRVFNKPTVSEVAAIWSEPEDSGEYNSQHIRVYPKDGPTQIVKHYFGCYDPMQYPLILTNGEPGWHPGIERLISKTDRHNLAKTCNNERKFDARRYRNANISIEAEKEGISKNRKRKNTISCREYYCYKLQMRPDDTSFLLHTGRLLQQFVIDMYIKIETSRLEFLKSIEFQNRMRTEIYKGVMDSIVKGHNTGADIGKRVILPTSFVGGPRDMHKRYMDAMTLVQRYGKPDIFLTMTANPSWVEILKSKLHSDETQNRPDLIARIFRAKLELLKIELFKKSIFGKIAAYTYVIEFQKRGLPHAHFLLILNSMSKLYSAEAYDRVVSAELPDMESQPYLYALVARHMMHGPCGNLDPNCHCMRSKSGCKYEYPKKFSNMTIYGENAYPTYRRRDDKKLVKVRGHYLDNRWVVPYNPYLLAKFNCHINVEICSTIRAIKYIFKYIYKGHDKIAYSIASQQNDGTIDEIKNFQIARWVSAPEAIWRIYSFDLNETYPAVISLPIHLEDEQNVVFKTTQSLHNVLDNPNSKKTMLTQYFFMNRSDLYAQSLNCLYIEFPEYFIWDAQSKEWLRRKQRKVIGRIHSIQPSEGEKYYLRLLLMHRRGSTSFRSIRTINGKVANTYKAAAELLGMLHNNNIAYLCMQESIHYMMPAALRQLFATLLVYANPEHVKQLWSDFEENLSEDFARKQGLDHTIVRRQTLHAIDDCLHSMNKSLQDFDIIDDLKDLEQINSLAKELEAETNIIVSSEELEAISKLNGDQKQAYDVILHHIKQGLAKAFFIDGPAGTGKTFLYKCLLAKIRSDGGIALATASSGVAASILPGGRTAHSRFKISVDDDMNKVCNISKQSTLAYLLRIAKLIIWDEATMMKRNIIEHFDIALRDLTAIDQLFGGKVIVFGGDFRQTLPVIPKGSKEDIINASIVMSPLWPKFEKLQLQHNMRAQSDPDFSQYLLRIGNGLEEMNEDSQIEIPESMIIPFVNESASVHSLIHAVFPDLNHFTTDLSSIINKAILTTRNDFVHEMNNMLIAEFPGEEFTYYSIDEATNFIDQVDQQDLLHSLTPQGFPPHQLTLKINSPIMLLRNINPSRGLSNGTRLICKAFEKNVILAEICTGSYIGTAVFIPRIMLECSKHDCSSIPFKRTQFPVRLCFAMTINKAQGQTLDFVGIYLKEPVFSHGQLYVALSRAKSAKEVKVLIRPPTGITTNINVTKNEVYTEVLSTMLPNLFN